jgi:hypothetical protein
VILLSRKKLLVSFVVAILAIAGAAVLFACSQTPTSVPVRTFERAQRMDVVCLRLVTGGALPEPRPQEECAPVPPGVNGSGLQNQLFALVTQTTRGELAVVDLSAGQLVDQSRPTPGINFLPVGAIPTDVATAPDGKIVFVASAEPNKFAIYGVMSHRILGDALADVRDPDGTPQLASWPVCALPQRPGALTVVSRKGAAPPPAADGGAPPTLPDYELVVVLPGDRSNSAKLVTIDPRPFLRGSPRKTGEKNPDGSWKTDPSYDDGQQPVLKPGSLAPCPITSAIELSGKEALPASFRVDRVWPDGVAYVDGGVDLACDRPPKAPSCGAPPCCAAPVAPDAGAAGDAGTDAAPAPDAGACEPVTAPDAGETPLDLPPLDPPHPVAIARDDHTVYIADEKVPMIHVVDMTTPGAARELPPLIATSLADPSRLVGLRALALSPPTRDYKRFLYAVDRTEGSLLVYDVTDPATSQRTPLKRPHPELNPFQPEDRLAFATPVVAVAFARHDFPLSKIRGVPVTNARTGLLCNPNPTIDSDPEGRDYGFFYRANDKDDIGVELGPRRLRGIFAFATLANGQVVAIDVDDWDAPCRRPLDMSVATSSIAPPQPAASSPLDFDPYHAPTAAADSVTDERFFPISAPHRMRSSLVLKDDARTGNHLPRIDGTPQVTANGVSLPLPPAQGSEDTPLMLPTGPSTNQIGPSFSFEVPDVHIDQDWTVSFEGSIPGFDGISATLSPVDGYQAIALEQQQGRFCTKGVEDWDRGRDRAAQISTEIARLGIPQTAQNRFATERLDRRVTDYVQLTEDILPAGDDYWKLDEECWDPPLDKREAAAARHDVCERTFGAAIDQSRARDFPILEAYEDKLVLGRFFTFTEKDAAGKDVPKPYREVIYKDPTNAPFMKLMQCCFHKQVRFKVRTGMSWAVVGRSPGGGSGIGFLSHFTTDAAGRCVVSCDPRESLLNARAPLAPPNSPAVGRNSALAFRNPLFSFVMTGGVSAVERDTVYAYSSRGQFIPLTIDLGATTFSVNPQSMKYVETLGQIAVVDAASQGLVLIDLRSVSIARAPYF